MERRGGGCCCYCWWVTVARTTVTMALQLRATVAIKRAVQPNLTLGGRGGVSDAAYLKRRAQPNPLEKGEEPATAEIGRAHV